MQKIKLKHGIVKPDDGKEVVVSEAAMEPYDSRISRRNSDLRLASTQGLFSSSSDHNRIWTPKASSLPAILQHGFHGASFTVLVLALSFCTRGWLEVC